jgi:hypothetical protein
MPKTPRTPRTRARLVANAISIRRKRCEANPSSTCFTRAASGAAIARRGLGRDTEISPPPKKRYLSVILAMGRLHTSGSIWPGPLNIGRTFSPRRHQAPGSLTIRSAPAPVHDARAGLTAVPLGRTECWATRRWWSGVRSSGDGDGVCVHQSVALVIAVSPEHRGTPDSAVRRTTLPTIRNRRLAQPTKINSQADRWIQTKGG